MNSQFDQDKVLCYIKQKERPKFIWSSPQLYDKAAKSGFRTLAAFIFYSFLFFKYERTAITVLITVATQVTTAITSSHVISKPPFQIFPDIAEF